MLAGYKGDGIDVEPEIHNFAEQLDLDIKIWDIVQHGVMDQPSCGQGCSGNPYDAKWAFGPVRHGDLHEIGHTVEQKEFRFEDWDGHASTNMYSYYSKSRYFHNSGGTDVQCQTDPNQESLYETLNAAALTADPTKEMSKFDLFNWKYGRTINVHVYMAAQRYGELANGWHLLAREHIVKRNFDTIVKDEADWNVKKANIGFDNYSFEEAKNISRNDWLLIVTSFSARLDFVDYFNMWGYSFSDKAIAQVKSYNYTEVPRVFFDYTNGSYCEGFSFTPLLVDGNTIWPH